MIVRTKAKIRFIDFVRPDHFPYPYSIEQAFHVFQWLVATGSEFTRYQHPGVYDLLSMKPSVCGIDPVYPITSLSDLQRRFHWALLSGNEVPLVVDWKKSHGISIQTTKWIRFPHYDPFAGTSAFKSEDAVRKALEKLLGESRGKDLNVSLNSCHLGARWVRDVKVAVHPKGFTFVMDYSFPEDSSWWHYSLATTENNEPFTDTLRRAIDALAQMTE